MKRTGANSSPQRAQRCICVPSPVRQYSSMPTVAGRSRMWKNFPNDSESNRQQQGEWHHIEVKALHRDKRQVMKAPVEGQDQPNHER